MTKHLNGPAAPRVDRWILPLFFAANAALCAWLIPALGVRAALYHTFPWIFGAAFVASLVPTLNRRLIAGPLPWRLAPVLLYAAVISAASSVNPSAPTGVTGNVFHPVEFAGLALLAQFAAHGGLTARLRWWRPLAVWLACVLFGVADELHQAFVPRRVCSGLDVGLDALGAFAGTLIYLTLHAWAMRRSKP